MRLYVGTSGYSYKEWKGTFYPDDLPAAKMLAFYAEHFETVEINNTFYRMPEPKLLEGWASQVPENFTFVLKAPQRITHSKGLVGKEEDVRYFLETSSVLGPRLGPALFQLPPYLRKDVGKLRDFLALIPSTVKAALEVRHDSWLDEEVYDLLRSHDVALCLSDTNESAAEGAPIITTASWGYLRLRRTEYAGDLLANWRKRIEAQPWDRAFVFFKHEDEGKGPAFAKRFLAL